MQQWLHLIYKIPRNPSKIRVYVWRKLKKIGAVLLHDSIWCLPYNSKTKEQFQWLATEIQELGGEATVWDSRLVLGMQDEMIINVFLAQADKEYSDILDQLSSEEFNLVSLTKRYHQTNMIDYFQSQLGEQVFKKIQAVRGGTIQ
jgi:hypothetical protein